MTHYLILINRNNLMYDYYPISHIKDGVFDFAKFKPSNLTSDDFEIIGKELFDNHINTPNITIVREPESKDLYFVVKPEKAIKYVGNGNWEYEPEEPEQIEGE